MVTYKVLLDTRRAKSDGTYAVTIRITFNRKSSTFNTGAYIREEFWNEAQNSVRHNHANAKLLNKKITEAYLKVQKVVLELEGEEGFTFEELKERLSDTYQKPKQIKAADFNVFAAELIADMFAINKAGNAIIYQTATKRLMKYANTTSLKFTGITYMFLDGFRRELIKDKVKQNTISNYFRTIRAIYNKGIKAKLVDRSHYPFLDIPIKTERTAKRAINANDVRKIYNATYKPKTAKWHARNYFLLSFCFRGASFTDLAYLTPENICKGRLIYKRRKTGSELNISLSQLALDILVLYKCTNEKYLLPILSQDVVEDSLMAKNIIYQWIKTTNKWLRRLATDCKIDADVTTYVTRHSWATIAKKLGYSNELIAECLGHQYGNKITNIYLDNFDMSVIDAASESVILSVVPCRKQLLNPYKYILNYNRGTYYNVRLSIVATIAA